MSKKSRLSHDQKRKQKLAKRNRRQPDSPSLAYTGNRYKSPEFVEPIFETEQGIYDMFVISGREITDDDVAEGLTELIEKLRARPAAELIFDATPSESDYVNASPVNLILGHWHYLLEAGQLPARDDLIGILRTLLGSIEFWRSKSMSSRGYLNYLEGFMLRAGYRVQVDKTQAGSPRENLFDELYEIGQMWLAGSSEARQRFTAFANELIERGESQKVVAVSQRLLGEIDSPSRPEFPILSELSIRAQKEQEQIASPVPAPGIKNFIARMRGW